MANQYTEGRKYLILRDQDGKDHKVSCPVCKALLYTSLDKAIVGFCARCGLGYTREGYNHLTKVGPELKLSKGERRDLQTIKVMRETLEQSRSSKKTTSLIFGYLGQLRYISDNLKGIRSEVKDIKKELKLRK